MHNGLKVTLEFGFNLALIRRGDTWHSMTPARTRQEVSQTASHGGKLLPKCLMVAFFTSRTRRLLSHHRCVADIMDLIPSTETPKSFQKVEAVAWFGLAPRIGVDGNCMTQGRRKGQEAAAPALPTTATICSINIPWKLQLH